MFNGKIFLVLDDVSHKNQVNFLLENLEWIKKGSKIVITTRDKSSIAEQVILNQKIKKVRGIFLDMSKVETGIPIDPKIFVEKFNKLTLRYLKIYDSLCPQKCEVDSKVNLPDGLEFPFKEIRCLHWLKFPLDELPPDFNPENLIDLRLPYNKIQRVWEAIKDTPWLKWVDLSYSTRLTDLGCSNFNNFELISENLESLHLDGTAIESLPRTMKSFKKLVLLNLENCKMLEFLPDCLDKLKALEELILSGCFRLQSFPDIKENMENLQILLLDGTSIKELPKMLLHCAYKTRISLSPPHETGDEQCTIKSTHVFIGYTNWLNINKCQEEDGEKRCVPTKASIKFEVADGSGEVTNFEVLKCGFSLVYESGSWEPSSQIERLEQGENRWWGLLGRIRTFLHL
ncbi:hypothetical protein F2Q69_00023715 [Brassica cretica]|uniref:NB-ARC domain-containing protein n=1 Tax=Brassica cretica TaxID=69181 RepID=A0A8S9PVN2_BRACR|nr:hypothetical protein F2Q69_00023715 [Brassica cretica]